MFVHSQTLRLGIDGEGLRPIRFGFVARDPGLRRVGGIDQRQRLIGRLLARREDPFLVGGQTMQNTRLPGHPLGVSGGVPPAHAHHRPVRHTGLVRNARACALFGAGCVLARRDLPVHDIETALEVHVPQGRPCRLAVQGEVAGHAILELRCRYLGKKGIGRGLMNRRGRSDRERDRRCQGSDRHGELHLHREEHRHHSESANAGAATNRAAIAAPIGAVPLVSMVITFVRSSCFDGRIMPHRSASLFVLGQGGGRTFDEPKESKKLA